MIRDERYQLMNQLLLQIAEQKQQLKNIKLCAFAPLKGHQSSGELMIVGRAVNGWDQKWFPDDNSELYQREIILKHLFNSNEREDKCPLSWIRDSWNSNIKDELGQEVNYHAIRSAVWRVFKRITETMGICDDQNWPSHLIWSNLYKISPADGGNPYASLMGIQEDICLKLLKLEILEWSPKKIIFFTGIDWANPFLEYLSVNLINLPQNKYVNCIGKYDLDNNKEAIIIVAKHPQGKNEDIFVNEVVHSLSVTLN
jgi:hypothetical protein